MRYSISQLAKRAGVPTTTIRFYERADLITPAGRTPSNYRYYDIQSLQRLHLIRAAHAEGFSIGDIKSLLTIMDKSDSEVQCDEVCDIVKQRLEKVRIQIRELTRLEKILQNDLKRCRAGRPDRCAMVAQLRSSQLK